MASGAAENGRHPFCLPPEIRIVHEGGVGVRKKAAAFFQVSDKRIGNVMGSREESRRGHDVMFWTSRSWAVIRGTSCDPGQKRRARPILNFRGRGLSFERAVRDECVARIVDQTPTR